MNNNNFNKEFLILLRTIPSKNFVFPSQKDESSKKKRSLQNIRIILEQKISYGNKINRILSHLKRDHVKRITKNNFKILMRKYFI